MLLGPLDVEQDVGKDPDSILVATHYQICKIDLIVCGDLTLRHTQIHVLLAQFDILQHLDNLVVKSQQRVQMQKTHQAEVAKLLI